jgi:toxin HigB-1
MIISFRNKATEDIYNGLRSKEGRKALPADLWKIAARKLDQLDAAARLDDLKVPPGNHLEKLKEDRAGAYSIRINQQYRICFQWTQNGPAEVEIVDYH